MKRFVVAVALGCVLSGTILAGNIPTNGAPEPAPATMQSSGVVATVILTILSLIR